MVENFENSLKALGCGKILSEGWVQVLSTSVSSLSSVRNVSTHTQMEWSHFLFSPLFLSILLGYELKKSAFPEQILNCPQRIPRTGGRLPCTSYKGFI